MADEIERYFHAQGWRPLAEWTLAELVNGAPEDPNNPRAFRRGRRPAWLERYCQDELRQRQDDAVRNELVRLLPGAVETLATLVDPESDVEPNTKLAAVKLLLDHVIGKPVQRVQAEVKADPMSFIAGAIVGPDGEDLNPSGPRTIDGTVTDA